MWPIDKERERNFVIRINEGNSNHKALVNIEKHNIKEVIRT